MSAQSTLKKMKFNRPYENWAGSGGIWQSAEFRTTAGSIALSAADHARLAALLCGTTDVSEALAFYHSVVAAHGEFPLEWEQMILALCIADTPQRQDLRERLGVVKDLLTQMNIDERGVGGVGDDFATIVTSVGRIALTKRDYTALLNLLTKRASAADVQCLRKALRNRQYRMPLEWEILELKATALESAHSDDALERIADLELRVTPSNAPSDTVAWLDFARVWTRFARANLIAPGNAEGLRAVRRRAVDDACAILTNPVFQDLTASQRVRIFLAVHNTLMSVPTPDLDVVSELGMRRFRELLAEPDLTEPQACAAFDSLHALYFAGASDTTHLRRFDSLVPAFESWLESRHGSHERPAAPDPSNVLTIAYLFHTAHLQRGNAVSPLILSLAEMHSARDDRRILLYLVQHVANDFVEEAERRGMSVRVFEQGSRYDRIDEIDSAIKNDRVDVVMTEQNRAIASSLYVRRVAPRQMWIDTGFHFWNLRALDWTISPVLEKHGPAPERASPIVLRQTADTLKKLVDEEAVRKVRADFPDDAFLLGIFVRLVKLDSAYIDFLERLLASDPRFQLIIAGPGDPAAVEDLMKRPRVGGRVKFVPGIVDLNVYGPAIDVMCDTFPFIGGMACREVAAHGVPIVSMLGTNWDAVLRSDRNPDLLADSQEEYINLVCRLANDPSFYEKQRQVVLEKVVEYSEPRRMIDDVEAAIAAACR